MKQILVLREPIGKIKEASDIFKKVKKINVDYSQENFMVFALDTKNKIIESDVLFKGGLNACMIDPKTIFRFALINNADKIIIAHNHPSGDLKPSEEDKEIYKLISEMGELLTLKVLDSIIFNKKEFYAMER